MRPVDAMLYRRVLHEWTGEQLRDFDRTLANLPHPTDDDNAMHWRDMLTDLRFVTGNGETYWVNSDMTAVAKTAAKTMPTQTLRRDDLPTDHGFLIYDTPIAAVVDDDHNIVIDGFCWTIGDPQPYWASTDTSRIIGPTGSEADDGRPPDGYEQIVDVFPLQKVSIPGAPPVLPAGALGYHLAWSIGDGPANDDYDVAPTLLATWTLMQQSLTVSERTSVDRAERRRCARAGLNSDVVVVRLRRHTIDNEAAEPEPEGSIAWSHRWLVGGHWRNQWLPSRAAHRLQWIAGYVKGPANLPLVVKDKVTAWIR